MRQPLVLLEVVTELRKTGFKLLMYVFLFTGNNLLLRFGLFPWFLFWRSFLVNRSHSNEAKVKTLNASILFQG